MEGRGHKVDVFEGDLGHHKKGCPVQGRQRHTFSRPCAVVGFVLEGVHRLYRLGLPIGDNVPLVFIQTKVGPYVHIEVVLIPFIAEKGIGPCKGFGTDEVTESRQFLLFGGEPPGVQVQVELVMVHDVLLDPQNPSIRLHSFQAAKPGIIPPSPNPWGHDICQDKTVDQFGKDEHFHV